LESGPFKVDEQHESVIRLSKRTATANVIRKSGNLFDQVINAIVGD